MCGIAGIIDFNGKTNSTRVVSKMLKAIQYRGPDESGIYHSKFATIGSVRLSIIDLASGQQPLSDPTGRYWIVYNGEIFNYVELRSELEKAGNRFRTSSDTEVIVQMYARYGKDCLGKLNGQFVFAIWDSLKEEVFFARDRVGIRPFFYHLENGVLSFGSEIKAIFQNSSIPRNLNPQGLTQVFTFWTAITPNTAFRDIYELPPGHYMLFSRKGLQTERFWQLNFRESSGSMSLSDAMEQFNELFSSAVRLRLRADVEVAAYLSGGLDSSTTVSYIKELEPGILNTFSIGFADKDFDESSYQSQAAKHFGTRHKSVVCTASDIARVFPEVVWHSETPLLRTAPAPMFILSKLVRENNIKVVITGEGSDEILAGYDIFREAIIRRFWANDEGSRLRPLLLKKIYPDIPHLRNSSPELLKMFFGYKLQDTRNPYYSHLLRWNNSNHLKKHLSEDFNHQIEGYSPFDSLDAQLPEDFYRWNELAQAQWIETAVFMSGYLLSSQGDRMSMANSVEGRYPFLDYRLIEFCNSLPPKFKLNGLNEKYLLKKLMQNKIPSDIIKRPKQPYRAPIAPAFLAEDAPEYLKEVLSEGFFKRAGLFDYSSSSAFLEKIRKSRFISEVDNMFLATLISSHLLYLQYIENFLPMDEGALPDNFRLVQDHASGNS